MCFLFFVLKKTGWPLDLFKSIVTVAVGGWLK